MDNQKKSGTKNKTITVKSRYLQENKSKSSTREDSSANKSHQSTKDKVETTRCAGSSKPSSSCFKEPREKPANVDSSKCDNYRVASTPSKEDVSLFTPAECSAINPDRTASNIKKALNFAPSEENLDTKLTKKQRQQIAKEFYKEDLEHLRCLYRMAVIDETLKKCCKQISKDLVDVDAVEAEKLNELQELKNKEKIVEQAKCLAKREEIINKIYPSIIGRLTEVTDRMKEALEQNQNYLPVRGVKTHQALFNDDDVVTLNKLVSEFSSLTSEMTEYLQVLACGDYEIKFNNVQDLADRFIKLLSRADSLYIRATALELDRDEGFIKSL